ncbi:DEAD/DEAH box helicase [Candidatus Micrarchaeota archaeon]|nr:DEAD/DEAH box helicase [Candidatus Micrarchaeota archaeon]
MPFQKLNLIEPLMRALHKQGYVTPTPIQEKAIPPLLDGRDLMGIAQTGTGKTAAFTLPILQLLSKNPGPTYPKMPKVLILTPTRELAMQIDESIGAYGEFLRVRHTVIFGGVGQNPQVRALAHGVDFLIATPGRLLDLIQQRHINLNAVQFFVLDEADRMLDMGFYRDVKKVIALLPHKRHSLFFSATMSPQITELANTLLKDPFRVEVTPERKTVEKIDQRLFFVDSGNKDKLLVDLLRQSHLTRVLVFTLMKHKANKVAAMLDQNGIKADAIHGNKSQTARIRALESFKSGHVSVLVATDIAARGIDIDDISHVINYDLPNEPETYVHRIGRTARAGAEGTAYSFCAADERSYLNAIQRLIGQQIQVMDHPLHSESAKNATGAAAMPAPRGNRGGGRRFVPSGGQNRGHSGHGPSNRGGGRPFGGQGQGGGSHGGPRRPFRR